MRTDPVTTPFGRRSMSYAMLSNQLTSEDIEPGASVDKWKIYQALCQARPRFEVTDRALAVLSALISFYPKAHLCADDSLIVFPSNAQLSHRAHGMAEQTIRRHLAVLVSAGLVLRKDSANGKRFARRGRAGEIDEAFGFSLRPLLARADEIRQLADEVEAERLHMRRMKERLTICRRDVLKLIGTALEEGAEGDWLTVQEQYRTLLDAYPRKPSLDQVQATLDEMAFLRENILNQLETQFKLQKSSGNATQTERHIQNSKPNSSIEFELRLETKQEQNLDLTSQIKPQDQDTDKKNQDNDPKGRDPEVSGPRQSGVSERGVIAQAGAPGTVRKSINPIERLRPFPLAMVLSACRDIVDYGPSGAISNWRDLMAAAVVVRSMLGVSPSAYEEACAILGPENAATVIACILERGGHINCAGGYLRDLSRRAERGEFSLGPMLMAQIRANGAGGLKTG